MKELWTEKYRPKKLDDYVFVDPSQKEQISKWIKEKNIPHLLLSGVQGTGKTTLGMLLISELGIHDADVCFIKGSVENGVDEIRDKVVSFASTMGFGDTRIVFLDEADYLSVNAQAALRNVMETYSTGCRFILTANYPHKIIPAIHSRCQGFHVEKLDQVEFSARVATILLNEGVSFDIDTLDIYVDIAYPDLRKCINLVELNTVDGVLNAPSSSTTAESDYKLESIKLFKEQKYTDARKLICSQIRTEEYEDFFRFLYDNLDLWNFSDPRKEDEAIVIIRNGLAKHTLCADPEINLAATLVELEMLSRD